MKGNVCAENMSEGRFVQVYKVNGPSAPVGRGMGSSKDLFSLCISGMIEYSIDGVLEISGKVEPYPYLLLGKKTSP